jgi:7-carboxy-7-deazaguanine synthase
MAIHLVKEKIVLVSEIFKATQGEGMHIGKATVFIRTGGCDYRCSWCDTLYAVLPEYSSEWKPMTPMEIFIAVEEIAGEDIMVTLSGGNPAMQKNLGAVISLLQTHNHHVTIETQGTVFPQWATLLNSITLSPKPPSSDMEFNSIQLERWILAAEKVAIPYCLKVVIANDTDYEWARRLYGLYPDAPFYLQVCNVEAHESVVSRGELLEDLGNLQDKVLKDHWYDAIVLPQLQVLVHGNKRGV